MMGIDLGVFELGRRFGRGGGGEVWSGCHRTLGVPVAVKFLFRDRAHDADALRAEATAMARVDHPHVIGIHELGRAPQSAPRDIAGRAYMVLEYARHGSLAPLCGRLRWFEVARALTHALKGLAQLHARRLLHLDVKPANLLAASSLSGDELTVKVSDLGLVRRWRSERERRGDDRGTPGFVAPEQRAGGDVGPWTDLYALGVTGWTLLTGHTRRQAPNADLDAPRAFIEWLEALTATSPRQRPELAADALNALRELLPDDATLSLDALRARGLPDDVAVAPQAPQDYDDAPTLPTHAPITPPDAPLPAPRAHTRSTVVHDTIPGAGLALFTSREPRLVGRQAPLDALDAHLRAAREGHPRSVVITGPTGIGKTQLAVDWCRRVETRGDAQVVTAPRGALDTSTLGGLLATTLRLLSARPDAWTRVEASLHDATPDAPHLRAATLRLLRHGVDASLPSPMTLAQALDVTARTLTACARRRPLVLWLDDRDPPSIAPLIAQLTEEGAPLLCLSTHDTRAATLTEPHHPLALSYLSDAEIFTLTRRRLGVSSAVAERVTSRAKGDPRFAVELVRDWIARALLEPTPAGLALRPGASLSTPDSIQALWRRRAQTLLDASPPDEQRALQLAARLGPDVDTQTWRACLDALPDATAGDLVTRLIARGVASLSPSGWRFRQSALVETLVAMQPPNDAALNAALIQGLERRWPHPRPLRISCHVAALRLDAGRVDEAIAQLLDDTRAGIDTRAARALLDLFERLDATDHPKLRDLAALRARAAYACGDNERAITWARAAIQEGRASDARSADPLFGAHEVASLVSMSRGDLRAAGDAIDAMTQLADACEDPAARLRVDIERARWLVVGGRAEEGVALLEATLDHPHERDARRLLHGRCILIDAALRCGLFALARSHSDIALREAQALGLEGTAVHVHNSLGDLALQTGELDQARDHLLRALALNRDRAPVAGYIHSNLANVDLRRGDHEAARARFEATLARLPPDFRGRLWVILTAGLQRCLATQGADASWDALIDEMTTAMAQLDVTDAEVAEHLSWSAERWAARGDPARDDLARAQRARALSRRVKAHAH